MANSISRPNSRKTSKSNDEGSSYGSIFSPSRNNSSNNVLRRRQSEQIAGRVMTRRGHQRHNSMIEPDHLRVNHSTSISMQSGIDENESIDRAFKAIYAENGIQQHVAEINRAPTPFYDIDENFGEKVSN